MSSGQDVEGYVRTAWTAPTLPTTTAACGHDPGSDSGADVCGIWGSHQADAQGPLTESSHCSSHRVISALSSRRGASSLNNLAGIRSADFGHFRDQPETPTAE